MQINLIPNIGKPTASQLSALKPGGAPTLFKVNGQAPEVYQISRNDSGLTVSRHYKSNSWPRRACRAFVDFVKRRGSTTTRASKLQLEVKRVDTVSNLIAKLDNPPTLPKVLAENQIFRDKYEQYKKQLQELKTELDTDPKCVPDEALVVRLRQFDQDYGRLAKALSQPDVMIDAPQGRGAVPGDLLFAFNSRQTTQMRNIAGHFQLFDFDVKGGPSAQASEKLSFVLDEQSTLATMRNGMGAKLTEYRNTFSVSKMLKYWEVPFACAYKQLHNAVMSLDKDAKAIQKELDTAQQAYVNVLGTQKLYKTFSEWRAKVDNISDGKHYYDASIQQKINSLSQFFDAGSASSHTNEEINKITLLFENVKAEVVTANKRGPNKALYLRDCRTVEVAKQQQDDLGLLLDKQLL